MSVRGKLLDYKAIIKLAAKHSKGEFNENDEALILFAGLAYFSAHELTLLKVEDLITDRGLIVIDGVLPSSFSATGKERYFFIGDNTYLSDSIFKVIEWRLKNKYGCLDRSLFAGLDPKSPFFLKDNGTEYKLNYKRRFEGDTVTQPLQMQRKFKSYYFPEGVSITTLLNSFIENVWLARSRDGTFQAIRDLVGLTGLSKETLRTKCIREKTSIQDVLENLYQ